MLVFVDESGDSGMRLDKGSSLLFAVGLVVFRSDDEATRCDAAIGELKSRLGLPAAFEFHFAENSSRQRRSFLQTVSAFAFETHVFAVDKARTRGPGLQIKESLYKWTSRMAFENAAEHLEDATVVIDGSGDRTFRRELVSYLRRRLNDGEVNRIRSVKLQPAHQNHLLQLADYSVSVSTRRMNMHRESALLYREFLARHEKTLRKWPTTPRRASP